MINKRYANTESIVGQFLPRVYTRRITLEDSRTFENLEWRDYVTTLQNLDGASDTDFIPESRPNPGTAITIDFHIKDIFSENSLGILTNRPQSVHTGNIHENNATGAGYALGMGRWVRENEQEKIISALKIGLILCSTKESADYLYKFLITASLIAQGKKIELSSLPVTIKRHLTAGNSFEVSLQNAINAMHPIGPEGQPAVIQHTITARPQVIGFELRNSQFEQYDSNNNLVNVIPYKKTIKISNDDFNNCEDLTLICFSYFDFSQLNLENISQDTLNKLGYFLGDIVRDKITSDGDIISRSIVYRDAVTNEPYNGPIHKMEDGTVMSGLLHSDSSRRMRVTYTPKNKIQDFRSIERSKMVNFQPASIIQQNVTGEQVLIESYISKRNKNFFGIYNTNVQLDRDVNEARIFFEIDMFDIYKNNSRYYNIVKHLESGQEYAGYGLPKDNERGGFSQFGGYNGLAEWVTDMLRIQMIQVVRRRVTKRLTGTNKMSTFKRVPFREDTEQPEVIATLTQTSPIDNVFQDDKGLIMNITDNTSRGKVFYYVVDKKIHNLADSQGVYEYGIKLRLEDRSREFFRNLLKGCRELLNPLNEYLEEALIPIGDSHYTNNNNDTLPLGLGEESQQDSTAGRMGIVKFGNYDRRTNTFTKRFRDHVRDANLLESVFGPSVLEYVNLVRLSFAKETFSFTAGNTTLQSGDDIVNRFGNSPLVSLQESKEYELSEDLLAAYLNMLRPNNATPESIRNFINAFEEAIQTLENFFDFKYNEEGMTPEQGKGYTTKALNVFELQRYLPEYSYRPLSTSTSTGRFKIERSFEIFSNEDSYIDFSKTEEMVGMTYNYPVALPALANERRFTDYNQLDDVYRLNSQEYGAAESAPAMILPTSITLGFGTIEIFFDKKEMEKAYPSNREPLRNVSENITLRPGTLNRNTAKPLLCDTVEKVKKLDQLAVVLGDYQKRHGPDSATQMLKALDNKVMPSSTSEEVYKIMEGITNAMRDNAFQELRQLPTVTRLDVSSSPVPLVRPAPTLLNIFSVNDSNECGLYDNRLTGNRIVSDVQNYERDQGFDSFYRNVVEFYNGSDYVPPAPIIREVLPVFDNLLIRNSILLASSLRSISFTPRIPVESRMLSVADLKSDNTLSLGSGTVKLLPAVEAIRAMAINPPPAQELRAPLATVRLTNNINPSPVVSTSQAFSNAAANLHVLSSATPTSSAPRLPLIVSSNISSVVLQNSNSTLTAPKGTQLASVVGSLRTASPRAMTSPRIGGGY